MNIQRGEESEVAVVRYEDYADSARAVNGIISGGLNTKKGSNVLIKLRFEIFKNKKNCQVLRFEKNTKIPILLNTPFNNKDQPIVRAPANAIKTFKHMGLDYLVIGN